MVHVAAQVTPMEFEQLVTQYYKRCINGEVKHAMDTDTLHAKCMMVIVRAIGGSQYGVDKLTWEHWCKEEDLEPLQVRNKCNYF